MGVGGCCWVAEPGKGPRIGPPEERRVQGPVVRPQGKEIVNGIEEGPFPVLRN